MAVVVEIVRTLGRSSAVPGKLVAKAGVQIEWRLNPALFERGYRVAREAPCCGLTTDGRPLRDAEKTALTN